MDFITIHFETANIERNSPCSLSLSIIEDNIIINNLSWLIKPKYNYFDEFNTMIHGISSSDVEDKPEFYEIWEEIKPLIENKFVITHNAGFHMSVLRHTLDLYSIQYPNLSYCCSYIFSKKQWKGLPSYDLENICSVLGIPCFGRESLEMSESIADIALLAFEQSGVKTIEDIPSNLQTTIGQLSSYGTYIASKTKRIYKPRERSKIIGDPSKHNPDSMFYGRNIVFTGTLLSLTRAEAQKIIADIGGILGSGVTKETDYLIVGYQDYRVVGEEGMSAKQKKAINLIEKGFEIEILSEQEFLKHL